MPGSSQADGKKVMYAQAQIETSKKRESRNRPVREAGSSYFYEAYLELRDGPGLSKVTQMPECHLRDLSYIGSLQASCALCKALVLAMTSC